MIEELKMPDWMKKDTLSCLATTIVSASPPQIPTRDSTQYEFDDEHTSGSLFSLKKAKRHVKTREMLDKDSMLIVPKKQIQTIPGLVDNDACNFDFFNHSIRPTKNHKRDLQ